MATRYEAVVVFDPNLSDTEVTDQIEKINAIVLSHGGSVERKDIWGRRELSYKIQKRAFGIYAVLVFSGENTLVSDLRRQLKINDAVLRSLIVYKDQYAPDMVYRPNEGPGFRDARGGAPEDGEPEADELSA